MSGFFQVLAGPKDSIPFGGDGTYGITVFLGGLVLLTAGIWAGSTAVNQTYSPIDRSSLLAVTNISFAILFFSPAMYRLTQSISASALGIDTKSPGLERWFATHDGNPRLLGFFLHAGLFFLVSFAFSANAM